MKKLLSILFLAGFLFANISLFAQPGPGGPPPPPPPDPGTGGTNPPVGAAPVGSGLVILLGLAGVYTARKVYILNREDN